MAAFGILGYEKPEKMTNLDYSFMSYVSKYGKTYATVDEFHFRQSQYLKTVQRLD